MQSFAKIEERSQKKKGETEEEEKGPEIIDKELSEDERLAHLVAQINFATAVVPRGAYILNSSRQVVKNPCVCVMKSASRSEKL